MNENEVNKDDNFDDGDVKGMSRDGLLQWYRYQILASSIIFLDTIGYTAQLSTLGLLGSTGIDSFRFNSEKNTVRLVCGLAPAIETVKFAGRDSSGINNLF